MEFRVWMREMRKRKCVSQRDLARMTGLTQTAISFIELGKTTPYARNKKAIIAALQSAPNPAKPKETNGDMLRRMEDGELVFRINCPKHDCGVAMNDRDCYQCKLDWLQAKHIENHQSVKPDA